MSEWSLDTPILTLVSTKETPEEPARFATSFLMLSWYRELPALVEVWGLFVAVNCGLIAIWFWICFSEGFTIGIIPRLGVLTLSPFYVHVELKDGQIYLNRPSDSMLLRCLLSHSLAIGSSLASLAKCCDSATFRGPALGV